MNLPSGNVPDVHIDRKDVCGGEIQLLLLRNMLQVLVLWKQLPEPQPTSLPKHKSTCLPWIWGP